MPANEGEPGVEDARDRWPVTSCLRIPAKLAGALLALALAVTGCGQALDAGQYESHGPLPVDERNPVILSNDGADDNWSGEYAMLLANGGGLSLAGIVVGASNYWTDLGANATGWKNLVAAARSSGLRHVPDVTVSASSPLTAPADGRIESTVPNRSPGAQAILDVSQRLSLPGRPVVVLACTQLTDVADAYLMDPTVVERVVVVALLGSYAAPKGLMAGPNGDLDPWADWIVAQRFTYVQITAFYDQSADVTANDLPSLPKNAFGDWMAAKQPYLSPLPTAADQVAVLAVALKDFPLTVQRSSADTSAGFGSPIGQGPPLVPDANGNAWLVTEIAPRLAQSVLWQSLLDPHTFGSDEKPHR
jgi:hypothetical protein